MIQRSAIVMSCLTLACLAQDSARPSLIREARVLALRSDPAEVAPGQRVTFSVLAADGGGTRSSDGLQLSFCLTPKVLGDNRLASDACAQNAEQAIVGTSAVVPAQACARFGPNVPAGIRPSDPDATGGFYQPIRVATADVSAVGMLRLACPLTDAPYAITRAYREQYLSNRAPELTGLSITLQGEPRDPSAIPRSAELVLHAGWTSQSEETFVVYDRAARELTERREALSISWYASAGELASDTTLERVASNRFRAPDEPGTVHLWLVLRDDRGAQQFAEYALDLR